MDSKVPIFVSNNKAYVWDVDDIETLRSKHHICGTLLGTLPHLSQQNAFLGVPLVLLPEEAVFLVEKQFAVLVDDPKAHASPSLKALQEWNAERVAIVKQQMSILEVKEQKEKEEAAGRAMSESALRKRLEREAKRAAAAQNAAQIDSIHAPSKSVVPEPRPSSPSATPQTSGPAYTITVPGSSNTFSWFTPNPTAYNTIAAAQAAGMWTYPSTLAERAKCAVFQDLWEKDYFMGGGIKFGGDFLVYPGDPLRYHSHFTATVIESPNLPIRPMEIVAHGRLGTATKKNHLLCTWDEEKREVSTFFLAEEARRTIICSNCDTWMHRDHPGHGMNREAEYGKRQRGRLIRDQLEPRSAD